MASGINHDELHRRACKDAADASKCLEEAWTDPKNRELNLHAARMATKALEWKMEILAPSGNAMTEDNKRLYA